METPHVPVWKPAPFLRLLPLFCAGIVFQWYYPLSVFCISIVFIFPLVLLLSFRFLPHYYLFRFSFLRGVFVLCFPFLTGLFIVYHNDIRNKDEWVGNVWIKGDGLVCRLDDPLEEKEKRFRGEASVQYIVRNGKLIKACGRLYVYFPKGDSTALPGYGRSFVLAGEIRPVSGPGNPGDFDFRKYAAFRNIHHLVYLKSETWKLLPHSSAHPLYEFLFDIRDRILATLQQFIGPGSVEAGVTEALLIGYKQDLDKELVQAYSNTGVVHIIAISGMHLGLIYLMLQKLFQLLRLNRRKIISGLLQLIFLWMFSLLTGGSASVLRSAAMFSFIIAGNMIGKSASVYNSLACSAFFLLCFDPFLLWDAGFQLSHLAVAGLVTVQQPWYRAVYIKYKWLDKIWSLAAVTLAAQVFTLPACLYYFGQFPVYFLISNLLVVPLSTFILFGGLLLLIISPFAKLASYLGNAVSLSVKGMNEFVEIMHRLPGSVIEGLNQDGISVCLLYVLIIFLCCFLINRSKIAFFISLIAFLLMSGYSFLMQYEISRQEKMIVYKMREGGVIDFISGKNFVSWTTEQQGRDTVSLMKSRSLIGADEKKMTISMEQGPGIHWQGWSIYLIDSLSYPLPASRSSDSVMLIVRKNSRVPLALLKNLYKPALVVFDGSCSLWKIEKWQIDCEKLHLRSYSIPHQGALLMNRDKLIL